MSCPVLVYLDAAGCRRSFTLADRGVVTLGRRPEADVCLPWDAAFRGCTPNSFIALGNG